MQVHPNSLANLRHAPFQKGHNIGRHTGSRDKLTRKFISDLAANYEKNVAETIEKVRLENPTAYINLVASLLPKNATLTVQGSVLDQMSPDELTELLAAVRAYNTSASGESGASGGCAGEVIREAEFSVIRDGVQSGEPAGSAPQAAH